MLFDDEEEDVFFGVSRAHGAQPYFPLHRQAHHVHYEFLW